MGLEYTIRFPAGGVPAWDAINGLLARVGGAASVRMIDGQPAFPDEIPEAGWREVRVGFPAGMVTVRRAADTLTCIVWSNADAALLAARDRLAWACAAAGNGEVETDAGSVGSADFARHAGLSPA